MGSIGIRIRRALFGISSHEADYERRGFVPTSAARRDRLETIARTFIAGYNAALAAEVDDEIDEVDAELRGFAVEGEAMACAVLDYVTPWRRDRWATLTARRAEHVYMIHVGAGWATARLRASLPRAVERRDPLLGWLVADGWGFHQAYFHPSRWASGQMAFAAERGYLSRAVDQGIGRALWFVAGADPSVIAHRVALFAIDRHADLWSGVGLAAAYAGGADRADLCALASAAAPHQAHLRQGVAFASAARMRAGNLAPHVELAARVLTGRDAAALASLSGALEPAAERRTPAAYEEWRAGVREALRASEAA